jgi:hypothetical protein
MRTCLIDGCDLVLVSKQAWFAMDAKAREGKARHGGRGLCKRHYDRIGGPDQGLEPREYRRADEVLEDWVMIKDSCRGDIRVAAPRMGMSVKALEQVLYRARQRGDERGNVPPRWLLGRGVAS